MITSVFLIQRYNKKMRLPNFSSPFIKNTSFVARDRQYIADVMSLLNTILPNDNPNLLWIDFNFTLIKATCFKVIAYFNISQK